MLSSGLRFVIAMTARMSDIKTLSESFGEGRPPSVAGREAEEVGVARYVVCAQAVFNNDGMGIALQKLTQPRFEMFPSSKDARAGQFGYRQVEQVVYIPAQVLLDGGLEISVSQTDGVESPEHFAPDFVRSLPAAPGGVADHTVGQRRGAVPGHRRPDVDVLSRRQRYDLSAFESTECQR